MLVKRLFIILSIASLCLAVRGDFDISNLNPLKWPMNFVRVVVRSLADKEMGVWFVRRPLKNMGIGITLQWYEHNFLSLWHFNRQQIVPCSTGLKNRQFFDQIRDHVRLFSRYFYSV